MPQVGDKKFPYTKEGKARAAAARRIKHGSSKRHKRQVSSFNVEKEYAQQEKDQASFIKGETKRSRADARKMLGQMVDKAVGDAKVARKLVEFKKSKRPKKQPSEAQLKETRYLADAKSAREGILDLRGTKAPPLPKNWRKLDKKSGVRQLFREWFKQNQGKKAKTKKPKVNLRKHLARFERATGQK